MERLAPASGMLNFHHWPRGCEQEEMSIGSVLAEHGTTGTVSFDTGSYQGTLRFFAFPGIARGSGTLRCAWPCSLGPRRMDTKATGKVIRSEGFPELRVEACRHDSNISRL